LLASPVEGLLGLVEMAQLNKAIITAAKAKALTMVVLIVDD